MESANRSPEARTVFPCARSRACAEYGVILQNVMVIWHQNSSAPYPNNPLRDGDGEALMDVSSFILFLRFPVEKMNGLTGFFVKNI